MDFCCLFWIVDLLICGIIIFFTLYFRRNQPKSAISSWMNYRLDWKLLATLLFVIQVFFAFSLGFLDVGGQSLHNYIFQPFRWQAYVFLWEHLSSRGFWDGMVQGVSAIFRILDGDVEVFGSACSFTSMLLTAIPILGIGTLLMALLDHFPRPFLPRKEYLIFSQADDHSLILAKNMMIPLPDGKARKDRKVIFLHTEKDKLCTETLQQLTKLKARCYRYSAEDLLKIHRGLRRKKLRFFFLSQNEDESFDQLNALITSVKDNTLFLNGSLTRKRTKITNEESCGIFRQELYFLSESDVAPLLVDRLRCDMTKNGQLLPVFRHTDLRLLDRYRIVTGKLLWDTPLYENAISKTGSTNKDIHILILGFGKVGQSFFRSASAFSHIPGYNVSFTIYDNKINEHWGKLLSQAPKIKNGIKVTKKEVNIETNELIKLLQQRKTHTPFTHIILSIGSDERNIRVTKSLVRLYRKLWWTNTNVHLPSIYVNLENPVKASYLPNIFSTDCDNEALARLRPHVIGGNHDTFSEETLLNRPLWEAARKVHHELLKNPSANHPPFLTEYQRRSSISAVLFSKYHNHANTTDGKDEHIRWMRYSHSEGMQYITEQTAQKILGVLRVHRDDIAGLSPCLIEETAALDKLFENLYSNSQSNQYKFTTKDTFMVKNATAIDNFLSNKQSSLVLEPISEEQPTSTSAS